MEEVRSVFEKMSDQDLLEKCPHGKTTNANECANSTVWNILSKNGFANRYLVKLVVSMAKCLYNEGKIAVIDVLSSLGIPLTREMVRRCKAMDKLRVTKKQRAEEYGKNAGKMPRSMMTANMQLGMGSTSKNTRLINFEKTTWKDVVSETE